MSPVVLYTPARKSLGLLLAGAVMTAASGFLVWGDPSTFMIARVVGWAGLVFFGFATLVVLARLIRRGPVMKLDDDGIEILASAFGRARIPWEEVDRIVVRPVFGQRMLGIAPKDADRWLADHSPAYRVLARANLAYGAPFWVAESTLPVSCRELAERIRQERQVEVFIVD